MNTALQADVSYFAQQPPDQLQWIISGMTALMQDTEGKAEAMQSQSWFQRMVRTVTGRNRLTLSEIQQNHEQLNQYMAEALDALYQRNCVNQQVLMSLGMQLNEIYANQAYLKQMMGAFVQRLNAKIESVDNFHMLVTEIEQGVYTTSMPLVGICQVLSQLDNRTLDDRRKLDIIQRDLERQRLLTANPVPLTQHLTDILSLPQGDAGQIYMELGTIHENFMAGLLMKVMEGYYLLPDMARRTKNRSSLVNAILQGEMLDSSATFSTGEIYEDFLNSKLEVKSRLVLPSAISEATEPESSEPEDLEWPNPEPTDANERYYTGMRYLQKNNVQREDKICAIYWIEKAAGSGHREAQNAIRRLVREVFG